MPGENIYDWSTTATSNSNADTSINWAEGQPRASVNNSARSLMAAHAKQRDQQNGSIVTGGTANAQTFFSGNNYTTVPTGMRVMLKIGPSLTNTGAATLNMDNISAVAIKTNKNADLIGGELLENSYAEFRYDGTNWVYLNFVASGLTLINEITITTTIIAADFTTGIVGDHDVYVFEGIDIVPAVNNAALWVKFSQDGGLTWKSTSPAEEYYRWTLHVTDDFGGNNVINASTDFQIVAASALSSAPGHSCSFTMRLMSPANTTMRKQMGIDVWTTYPSTVVPPFSNGLARWTGAGAYGSDTNAVNGVRFLMSSGDIASGKIRMYSLG